MHYRRPPSPSTLSLIAGAPLEKLRTGTRAVIEIVGYPDGQMRLTASVISGPPGNRTVKQRPFLMFQDADETKDALDWLVDRVDQVARAEPSE